ncbi:diguanylate cyclase [Evansella sp. AB-rgal1]|uniref:diguanylate cyclase n=1 Tax=Evansella sp. AB-rgal1 TaxID=3242696 RepID=UPI00359E51B6
MSSLSKYQEKFIKQIGQKINDWNERGYIEERELYQFLHTIRGTAGSIGLDDLSTEAERLLHKIDSNSTKTWSSESWNEKLITLLSLLAGDIDDTSVQRIGEENTLLQELPLDDSKTNTFILIIDQKLDSLNYFKTRFEEEGYLVLSAITEEKATEWIFTESIDLILINEKNFSTSFLENPFIKKAQSSLIPIVLITEMESKDQLIQCYHKGISDIYSHDMDLDILTAIISSRISFRQQHEDSLMVDELTGAYNRRFLDLEVQGLYNEMSRDSVPFSLAMVDIDHFKKVNDEHGHLIGDEVLKRFVAILLKNKRNRDTVIRYGGEEFCMIFPRTKRENAVKVLTRLQMELSNEKFHGNSSFFITFSAGVTEVIDPTKEINEIVQQADTALYNAKNNGRNLVMTYQPSDQNVVSRKLNIMIVDDDPIIREMLSRHFANESLRGWSTHIQKFKDGYELLHSNWYNPSHKYLFLLDGVMPKMDGMEILKILRENYSDNNVLILMLTSRKSEQEIVRSLELGADDYVIKPFKMNELSSRMKRLMRRVWNR